MDGKMQKLGTRPEIASNGVLFISLSRLSFANQASLSYFACAQLCNNARKFYRVSQPSLEIDASF